MPLSARETNQISDVTNSSIERVLSTGAEGAIIRLSDGRIIMYRRDATPPIQEIPRNLIGPIVRPGI